MNECMHKLLLFFFNSQNIVFYIPQKMFDMNESELMGDRISISG